MPIGTLMKNTARQSRALVSRPPKSTPAAMPMLAMVPQMARAVARCRPAYVVITIDRAAGVSIAAPAPWAPRARTSVSAESARPLTRDAPVKSIAPMRNIRAAVEEVGHPAPEQQQAAAEQHVGADRPLVVGRAEVQVRADARQGDVHDADVEDDHELGGEHEAEHRPRTARLLLVGGVRRRRRVDCVGHEDS